MRLIIAEDWYVIKPVRLFADVVDSYWTGGVLLPLITLGLSGLRYSITLVLRP